LHIEKENCPSLAGLAGPKARLPPARLPDTTPGTTPGKTGTI